MIVRVWSVNTQLWGCDRVVVLRWLGRDGGMFRSTECRQITFMRKRCKSKNWCTKICLFLNAGPPLFQSSNDVTAPSGDEGELFREPLLNAIHELLEILLFVSFYFFIFFGLFIGIFLVPNTISDLSSSFRAWKDYFISVYQLLYFPILFRSIAWRRQKGKFVSTCSREQMLADATVDGAWNHHDYQKQICDKSLHLRSRV